MNAAGQISTPLKVFRETLWEGMKYGAVVTGGSMRPIDGTSRSRLGWKIQIVQSQVPEKFPKIATFRKNFLSIDRLHQPSYLCASPCTSTVGRTVRHQSPRAVENNRLAETFSRYFEKRPSHALERSAALFSAAFSSLSANECNEVPARQIKGERGEPKFIVALSGTKAG